MKIFIEALEFDTIIGLLAYERITPQRVIVDVEIAYSYQKGVFINYAEVCDIVKDLLREEKFELLEDALEALFAVLKKSYPSILKISAQIMKPDILEEASVGVRDKISF